MATFKFIWSKQEDKMQIALLLMMVVNKIQAHNGIILWVFSVVTCNHQETYPLVNNIP